VTRVICNSRTRFEVKTKVIQGTPQTAYGSRGEGLKLVTKLSKALCTVFKVVPKTGLVRQTYDSLR